MHTLMRGLRIIGYLAWGIFSLIAVNLLIRYFGPNLRDQFYRWGLVLQLIGVLSVLAILIGAQRIGHSADICRNALSDLIEALNNQEMQTWLSSPKQYAWANLLKVILFGLIHLAIYALSSANQIGFWPFLLLFGVPLVFMYLWILSFILNLLIHLLHIKPPKIFAALFNYSDYVFSSLVVMVMLITVLPGLDGVSGLSKLTMRTTTAWITFPLILLGTVFQLVAAFL